MADAAAMSIMGMKSGSIILANNLREIRVREGLTISDLAKLADVSERTIGYIENGHRSGRDVTLYRLLNAINSNPKRQSKQEYTFEEVFPSNQPSLF